MVKLCKLVSSPNERASRRSQSNHELNGHAERADRQQNRGRRQTFLARDDVAAELVYEPVSGPATIYEENDRSGKDKCQKSGKEKAVVRKGRPRSKNTLFEIQLQPLQTIASTQSLRESFLEHGRGGRL